MSEACFEILAVPVPRDGNPVHAPAASLVQRLGPGQTLEYRLHRGADKLHCYLKLDEQLSQHSRRVILGPAGYLTAPAVMPKARTSVLLTRSIQERCLFAPDKYPVQLMLPLELEGENARMETLFTSLSALPPGSGISFFFRRGSLSRESAARLHRMNCPQDSLVWRMLFAHDLYEIVGCIYGGADAVSALTTELRFSFPGLAPQAVPATDVSAGLFRICCSQNPKQLPELKHLLLAEEVEALTDLRVSAGRYGLSLNKDTLLGIAVPRKQTGEGLFLGTQMDGTPVTMPLKDLRRHMLITAATGNGKGNLIFHICTQLHSKNIPFLVLEARKQELHTLHKKVPGLQVWRPEKGGFVLNPFALPPGITYGEYRSSLLDSIRQSFCLDGPLETAFPEAMSRAFARHHFTDNSTAQSPGVVPFGLNEVMEEFSRMMDESGGYSAKTKSDVKSAGLNRLNKLFQYNRDVFDTVNSVPVSQLLNGENLIQLNCLSGDARQMFASLLLIRIAGYLRLRANTDQGVSLVIIIDEAHELLQETTDANGRSYSFVSEYISMQKTLRSQGVGLITVTQTLSGMPQSLTDLSATKLFLGASRGCGVDVCLSDLKADQTALDNWSLLEPGDGLYVTPQMQQGLFFHSPNIIDGFLENGYPAQNAWLKSRDRFTLETYAECRYCPAKNRCTRKDKAAARSAAAVMLMDFSALSMPGEEKARNQMLLSFLEDQRKKNPSGQCQWYCTLIQFARDLNRKYPGALDTASLLAFAKKKWPAG